MFLGIDQSLSCTGLCVMDKKGAIKEMSYPSRWDEEFPQDTKIARLLYYKSHTEKMIIKHKIKYAAIENYAFGKAKSSLSFTLGELGGILKATLFEHDIPFINPGVTQVKLWTNAPNKLEVKAGLVKCWKCGTKVGPVKMNDLFICENPECNELWDSKSPVLSYTKKKFKIDFDVEPPANSPRAKTGARQKMMRKIASDIADATTICEMCRGFFDPGCRTRKIFTDKQLAVLSLLKEEC